MNRLLSTPIFKTLFKSLLSIFIVWHLLCILVLHNQDSLIYRHSSWIIQYGNFIGFNTTLRFFSPNPYMRLTEYDTYARNESGELVSRSWRFPKEVKEEKSRETHNRKYSAAMMLLSRPEFVETILGPKLCEWHPEAESISLYASGLGLESIEKSKLLGSSRAQIARVEKQLMADHSCYRSDK